MRIFYAAATTLDSSIPSFRLWYDHLCLPLVDLGYEMVQFDCDLSPHFRYLDISLPSGRFFAEENLQSWSRHFLSKQGTADRLPLAMRNFKAQSYPVSSYRFIEIDLCK